MSNARQLADFARAIPDDSVEGVQQALDQTQTDIENRAYRIPQYVLGRATFSDVGWNPVSQPVFGRSTPESALVSLGGHYDEIGAAGRNYLWGQMTHMTNPNTAPFTGVSAVTAGWKVRGMDATARQIGDDGDGHALEVISGQWAAKARVSTVNGSDVLTVDEVTFQGSRFCIGNAVSGAGVPPGSTIVSLSKGGLVSTGLHVETVSFVSGGGGLVAGDELETNVGGTYNRPARVRVRNVVSGVLTFFVLDPGDYTVAPSGSVNFTKVGGGPTGSLLCNLGLVTAGVGYPDTITISEVATATSAAVGITVLSADTMGVGILISGSGDGGSDGTGNPNGRGIQLQSYGNAAFLYGVNIPGSAIRTNGTVLRMPSVVANRGISFESCSLSAVFRVTGGTQGHVIYVFNTTCTSPAIEFSSVTGTNALRVQSNCTFSGPAILLEGQNIGTDSTIGMIIATSATQKLGFFGRTPVARPASISLPTGGSTIDAESRAKIEEIRNALRSLGLIAT